MKKQTIKDFYNPVSGDNRIYTGEEIGKMSLDEFQKNEDAIMYQYENLGVPYERQLKNNDDVVFVHEYKREDGTKVKSHYRSKPDGIERNNLYLTGGVKENVYLPSMEQFEKQLGIQNVNTILNGTRSETKQLMNLALYRAQYGTFPQSNDYTVLPKNAQFEVCAKYGFKGGMDINNMDMLFFNENSSISKELSKSNQLKQDILKHYNYSENSFDTDRINITLNENTNLHYSIGHGTILEPQVDNEGYFSGYLYDIYDFDFTFNYLGNYKASTYNNIAWGLQEFGQLKNYYVIIPVRFKI